MNLPLLGFHPKLCFGVEVPSPMSGSKVTVRDHLKIRLIKGKVAKMIVLVAIVS